MPFPSRWLPHLRRAASLAAAAVGARERGVRALAVTAEAALELVLLGAFSGGFGVSTSGDREGRSGSDSVPPESAAALAGVLAPAVGALAELDAAEAAAEASFFGGDAAEARADAENGGGFAGGVCADDGRLRALVRRARDALAAFAPPRQVEHPALLAGGRAFAAVGGADVGLGADAARASAAKRFGEGRAYQ